MKLLFSFLWSLFSTCAAAEEQKIAYSVRELGWAVSSIKMSLDLFNGEKFCVPKSTAILLEPHRASLSGLSLPMVAIKLSSRFPCSGISFESEDFTPKDVMDRLQTHPLEVIDRSALELPDFKIGYDINFISEFTRHLLRCPGKMKIDGEKMSELRKVIEVHSYMGNMHSRAVVVLLKQAAICE
jgi:hypothetical protein